MKRLVRLAHSEAPPTIQERFAIETFINGICKVEVKKMHKYLDVTRHPRFESGGCFQYHKNLLQSQRSRTREKRKQQARKAAKKPPVSRRSAQQRSYRDAKGTSTLEDVIVGENKAASKVKIRSLTKGSASTILGKINENPAAIIIDTGAEVSIVRRELVRAEKM